MIADCWLVATPVVVAMAEVVGEYVEAALVVVLSPSTVVKPELTLVLSNVWPVLSEVELASAVDAVSVDVEPATVVAKVVNKVVDSCTVKVLGAADSPAPAAAVSVVVGLVSEKLVSGADTVEELVAASDVVMLSNEVLEAAVSTLVVVLPNELSVVVSATVADVDVVRDAVSVISASVIVVLASDVEEVSMG